MIREFKLRLEVECSQCGAVAYGAVLTGEYKPILNVGHHVHKINCPECDHNTLIDILPFTMNITEVNASK